LIRFKAFIEMRDDATGAWRGRIEEGEVVEGEDRDEAAEPPEAEEQEEPEAEEREEPEAEEQEEPEAEEREEPEAEEQEEPEGQGDSAGEEGGGGEAERKPVRRRAPTATSRRRS